MDGRPGKSRLRQEEPTMNIREIIDLTQTLHEDAPTWDGACGYCSKIKKDYDQLFKVNRLEMDAGIGTHMDAPSHLYKEGLSIDKIPVKDFFAKLVIVDVSSRAHADYEITVGDLEEYERIFGKIPSKSLVVGFTGWCRYWNKSKDYRNNMHFPAFSKEAAEYLLNRDVAGIAIDTLSPDCQDKNYSVHHLFLSAGKYIIENIADCSGIPAHGAYVLSLPMKLQGCSEAPARIVALIPS